MPYVDELCKVCGGRVEAVVERERDQYVFYHSWPYFQNYGEDILEVRCRECGVLYSFRQ